MYERNYTIPCSKVIKKPLAGPASRLNTGRFHFQVILFLYDVMSVQEDRKSLGKPLAVAEGNPALPVDGNPQDLAALVFEKAGLQDFQAGILADLLRHLAYSRHQLAGFHNFAVSFITKEWEKPTLVVLGEIFHDNISQKELFVKKNRINF
jgi:hypothetical protein